MKDWWLLVLVPIVFAIVILDMTVNGGQLVTSTKIGFNELIKDAKYDIERMFDF